MSKHDIINKLVDMTLEQSIGNKICPKGYHWCEITNRCVRTGDKRQGQKLARGGGKGPMGKPRKEMFAMDTPELKEIEKQVDFLIDMCGKPTHGKKKNKIAECGDENDLHSVPSQDPEEELDRVHADIAGYGNPEDEDEEYPPGPQDDLGGIYDGDTDMTMGEQLEFVLKEEEYKEFFKSMMDKEGIASIKDLTGDKKKSFFDKVDASWKAKKETD